MSSGALITGPLNPFPEYSRGNGLGARCFRGCGLRQKEKRGWKARLLPCAEMAFRMLWLNFPSIIMQ